MKRSASAHWEGAGKTGEGHISTESGVFDAQPYSFRTRFGDGKGTNPEELIAAAHAGCFTMALSFGLAQEGFTAESLDTAADVTIEQKDGGFAITAIQLTLKAVIPGIDEETFAKIAGGAEKNCPVSRALAAVPITLDATLA